jgi:hypothetical protein
MILIKFWLLISRNQIVMLIDQLLEKIDKSILKFLEAEMTLKRIGETT